MKFHTATIDGKRIAYTDDYVFEVQLGKGSKGGYRTKRQVKGNLVLAIYWYTALNIGNGYKKRLVCRSFNRPTIARATS